MTTFTSIGVRPEHAQRAREIATHFEMNLAGYIGTIVDLEYKRVFGREPEAPSELLPILSSKMLTIGKGEQQIQMLLADAHEISDMLLDAAQSPRFASLKIDGLRPILISRRGTGVVVESEDESGNKTKLTLSKGAAVKLASKISETIMDAVIAA